MNKTLLLILTLIFSSSTFAKEQSFYDENYKSFKYKVSDTWYNYDTKNLYFPVLTWHNRYTYDQEHIEKYNEKPWGLGYGISKYDQKGNWNGIYLMSFKDSFNKWEPIGGYGWEKVWRPIENNQDFRLGLGYTAFITARHNWSYIPIPAALPLASIGYKGVDFQATYIPGTHNNGNVLFGWFKFNL